MSDSTQKDRREGMLRKVRALLAKANDTPFTEEADSFRQKADELMTMFAISEFELSESDHSKREQIINRTIFVVKYGSVVQQEMTDLSSVVARHCRCRPVYYGLTRNYKGGDITVLVVGFESDVDYFDLMFTSLQMHMANDLEPKYNTADTLGQNVRRMKESGMKWERIAQLANQAMGPDTIPFPGPKAISVYKKQCTLDGVQPMKTMPTVYVRNFAAGFVTEITYRLLEIREKSDRAVEDTGMSLVLFKSRDDEVTDEFRRLFPKLSRAPMKAEGKFDGNARSQGARSGRTADISKGGVGGKVKEIG